MPKTRDDITRRALQVLGALAGNEPVSAEDAAAIDLEASAFKLAGMRHVNLVADVQADAVPDEFFMPFAQFVAAQHGDYYGKPLEWGVGLEAKALADMRLISGEAAIVAPVSTNQIYSRGRPWRGLR